MKSTQTQDNPQITPAPPASRTSLVKVLCTRYSQWVHSSCSGLRNVADYRRANDCICTTYNTPPQPPTHSSWSMHRHTATIPDNVFNVLQWNANGINNKQMELSIFLEADHVKVVAIPESKLTTEFRSPNIQNYTLLRQDRRQGPGGDLLFIIHNFTRKPLSTPAKNDSHLEELTISIVMDNTGLLITNLCSPRPAPAIGVIHLYSAICCQAQIH